MHVEQSPTVRFREDRRANRRDWKDEPDEHGVDRYDTEIARPALQTSHGLASPRPQQFPERHGRKDAGEGAEPSQKNGVFREYNHASRGAL